MQAELVSAHFKNMNSVNCTLRAGGGEPARITIL